MVLRAAVALAGLLAVAPAFAEPMNAETARRFVAGKLFAFTCFEGSTGTGRIFNDGSVAGVDAHEGRRPDALHAPAARHAVPERRAAICSNVKGAFFNPCFELNKTSDKSFRGAVSGFGFAYCDFTRRGGRRETAAGIGAIARARGDGLGDPRLDPARSKATA